MPGGHSMTTWTQFCPFLTTTDLYVDIFNPEHGHKGDFLDHLTPLLVHVVIECPPGVAISPPIFLKYRKEYKLRNKQPNIVVLWYKNTVIYAVNVSRILFGIFCRML